MRRKDKKANVTKPKLVHEILNVCVGKAFHLSHIIVTLFIEATVIFTLSAINAFENWILFPICLNILDAFNNGQLLSMCLNM